MESACISCPVADLKDSGEELTDEEWAEFFANELGYNADDDSNDGGESTSPEDFQIPPSFVDDEAKPGVNFLAAAILMYAINSSHGSCRNIGSISSQYAMGLHMSMYMPYVVPPMGPRCAAFFYVHLHTPGVYGTP